MSVIQAGGQVGTAAIQSRQQQDGFQLPPGVIPGQLYPPPTAETSQSSLLVPVAIGAVALVVVALILKG